jgi:hypothetical protein
VGANDSIIVEEPGVPADLSVESVTVEEQQDSEEIVERSTIVDDADVEEFFETTI